VIDLKQIGVLAHPLRPQSFAIARNIRDSIRARGLDSWVYTEWAEEDIVDNVETADIVIAIGGDGAMLRAAQTCARAKVPVLGINMGQLGFLTEITDPNKWEERLDLVLENKYWIEERAMLTATATRDGTPLATAEALNDIVISGDNVGHMVKLETFIDADWTTTYRADALVIATATGSTAYALACGGPILPPELVNILIIPAAPHLSMSRPIVLADGSIVDVSIAAKNRGPVIFSADGATIAELQPLDQIRVQVSDLVSRFVRLRGRNYFYRSILDRLEPRVQRTMPEDRIQSLAGQRLVDNGDNTGSTA